MAVALVAGGVVLVLVSAALLSFNRFVRQRQLIDNSWSNIDTELKRRYELIPNLVRDGQGLRRPRTRRRSRPSCGRGPRRPRDGRRGGTGGPRERARRRVEAATGPA